MQRASIASFLHNFLLQGDAPAYAQRSGYRFERWSYRQIAQSALRLAQEFEKRGLTKGDRLLLWAPNSAEWVVTFFACALTGVVVVPMDNASTHDFVQRVIEQTKAKLLICSREHDNDLVSVPKLLLSDLATILSRGFTYYFAYSKATLDDPLEIIFTSGTTAEPKGVVITHGNVLSNIAPLETEIEKYMKYERFVHPIRFLNLLPLSHVFGQFLGIFLPQLMGGTVIFQESLRPSEILETIRQERISVLVSVPRVFQSLKEKIQRDLEDEGKLAKFQRKFDGAAGKHFLRRWWIFRQIHRRFGWKFWAFISGGAALDSTTEQFWTRLGFAMIQGYGLTETTSLISVNHPFKTGKGSIGKVLAGREVKLAPDGEILVRGGGVASTMLQGGNLRPSAGEEGWFHTGDVGEMDDAGNLYFKGRKKEVIVTSAGMNVYPEDVESAFKKQPEVKDCVVIPLHQDGNAEPYAVLILKDSASAPELIVQHANASLAEYQRVRQWFIWPEEDFPRTSTQKPKKADIAQTVFGQASTSAKPGAGGNALTDLIARITKRNPVDLSASADLNADLNLSSLDRVELLGALEDRYQVDLSQTSFASIQTVRDLERAIHGGGNAAHLRYHYPTWVQRWPVTWIRLLAHYLLLRPAVFLLGWPKIEGLENLRNVEGPVLVICNHIDDVDVGFILTALPARFRNKLTTAAGGEALESLHTPRSGTGVLRRIFNRIEWIFGVALLNLFPLPRATGFRESFAYAGKSVDRGYSVLIFPEGHHTTDGALRPFQAGIGILAKNLGVPVVPMRIDGLFEVKNAGKRIAPPGKIHVRIGAPVEFDPESDPQQIATILQSSVKNL